MKRLLSYLLPSLACIGAYTAEAVTEDFENVEWGNVSPLYWSQTWEADSPQQNSYQVADDIGYDGSTGLTLDVEAVKSSYRLLHQTPLVGSSISVSAKFRFELNSESAEKPNHPLFGVFLNSDSRWHKGKRVYFVLIRRKHEDGHSTLFGFTSSFDQGAPIGRIALGQFGLPAYGILEGETAQSDWFTMKLTLHEVRAGAWTMECSIISDDDTVIESFYTPQFTLPKEFDSKQPIYGGITLGWANSNQYKVLQTAKIQSLFVDDFNVEATD